MCTRRRASPSCCSCPGSPWSRAAAWAAPGRRAGRPQTQWMFDPVAEVSTGGWRLQAGDRLWSYPELAAFDDRVRAVIDCTGGWYSEQEWEGVRLARVLELPPGSLSILVRSLTG